MAKKTFIRKESVEKFLTPPEDNVEDQKEERPPNKTDFESIPMTIEDAKKRGHVETKGKKFQMLIQPSVFNKIKKMAVDNNVSINKFMHSLLEKAIEDDK